MCGRQRCTLPPRLSIQLTCTTLRARPSESWGLPRTHSSRYAPGMPGVGTMLYGSAAAFHRGTGVRPLPPDG